MNWKKEEINLRAEKLRKKREWIAFVFELKVWASGCKIYFMNYFYGQLAFFQLKKCDFFYWDRDSDNNDDVDDTRSNF